MNRGPLRNARALFLPGLALGFALLLVEPAERARGFSLLGHALGPGKRHFRLFDNFADSTANNNTTPDPMFPGWTGAELAMWKAGVEWGSVPHGDGSGDPTQAVLGNGGANFDGAWMGHADGVGAIGDNVISAVSSCGGGTLAYMEGLVTNGWRIRFCENRTWADGPGSISGGQFDIQAVQTHEYGHALGLGHSSVGGATMWPSIGSGSTSTRSINSDDVAGVQRIYGVADPAKPLICGTSVSGNTLTITGTRFDLVDNDVWFCPSAVTNVNGDPRVRVQGIPSTQNGTRIQVAIPAGAGPGDVLVKTSSNGGKSLSNAFPTDLAGTFAVPCPLRLTAISPPVVEALDPGTAQSVTLSGDLLDTTTQVSMNGVAVPPSHWTIASASSLTIDLPLGVLGANTLTVSDGDDSSSIAFTIVAPASPLLELGDGEPGNAIPNGGSMNIVVAGTPGTKHQVFYSPSNLPSVHPAVSFDIGNAFTSLRLGAVFTIGPDAYTQLAAPLVFTGGSPTLFYAQSVDVTTPPAPQFATSNVQSVTLVP